MDIKNKNQWNEAFIQGCQTGNLEEVRHLCQKQYLDAGFADIHLYEDYGFRWACKIGHLHIVKYLLTSPELKEAGHTFADLHAVDEEGFRLACDQGHLEMVKYLLTSPELKKAGHTFADLHAEDEYGFRVACRHGHRDLIHWLIMDYGIEKTKPIDEIIQEYPQAQEYFRVRQELQEIKNTISPYKHQKSNHNDERAAKKAKKL